MKQIVSFENVRKITSSLAAVGAGILTDILYDILTDQHFEGTFEDGVIELFSIDKYGFWTKCILVFFVFLTLWAFLAYGIPAISYALFSLIPVNKAKISTKVVLSTYKKCKNELQSIEERVAQGVFGETDYYLLFTDICQCVVQLYKVFCSGKDENISSLKDAFRTSGTIYDIGDKISSYEYLRIIDTLSSLFEYTHQKIKHCNSALLVFDHKEIKSHLDELSGIIVSLNVER